MAKSLTVSNTTYQYPDQGEDPTWGNDASDWAEAVTDVLDTLQGTGDILETSFTVVNNQTSADDVTNLLFSTSTVRGAVIEYTIYRKTDSTTSGNAECGNMFVVYDDNAGAGSKWLLSQTATGDAGMTFTITDAGQVQYTSTNISGANYTGLMKFRASAFTQ